MRFLVFFIFMFAAFSSFATVRNSNVCNFFTNNDPQSSYWSVFPGTDLRFDGKIRIGASWAHTAYVRCEISLGNDRTAQGFIKIFSPDAELYTYGPLYGSGEGNFVQESISLPADLRSRMRDLIKSSAIEAIRLPNIRAEQNGLPLAHPLSHNYHSSMYYAFMGQLMYHHHTDYGFYYPMNEYTRRNSYATAVLSAKGEALRNITDLMCEYDAEKHRLNWMRTTHNPHAITNHSRLVQELYRIVGAAEAQPADPMIQACVDYFISREGSAEEIARCSDADFVHNIFAHPAFTVCYMQARNAPRSYDCWTVAGLNTFASAYMPTDSIWLRYLAQISARGSRRAEPSLDMNSSTAAILRVLHARHCEL